MRRIYLGSLLGFGLLLLISLPVQAGVSVSIQPDTTYIEPDLLFTVYVYVDSAGSEFNGYEAVIRWDPQFLEPISVDQESLFEGYNQWWMPEMGPDSVFISHVILQGGVSVTGPGPLSSITFRALQLGQSEITFDYIEFYLGPYQVTPVASHDGLVLIIDPSSGLLQPSDLWKEDPLLTVRPNPITPNTQIFATLRGPASGELRLLGVDGRLLYTRPVHLGGSTGSQNLSWRLSSLFDSKRNPAGIFFLQLVTDHNVSTTRIVNIR